MSDSLKKALDGAVGIVGDPQRGYRAGIFFEGVPLVAVGPVREKFEEADADAQSIEKALALVLSPMVQETLAQRLELAHLLAGARARAGGAATAARKRCDCRDLNAIACAAAHFNGRGVDPAIAAAVALGAPCRRATCHAGKAGAA